MASRVIVDPLYNARCWTKGYQELASAVEPDKWSAETSASIISELLDLSRNHPEDPRWLQAALSAGQYEFAGGQFYGGNEPQWPNQRIQEVVQKHLLGRNVVWVDDFRRASSQ
jgi:hypothetical protein